MGSLSLSTAVLSTAYGGNMASFLTVQTLSALANRMSDLLDIPGMRVGNSNAKLLGDLRASPDPDTRRLADRYLQVGDWQEGMRRAAEGSYAFLTSKMSTEYNIRSQFTDRRGDTNVYTLSECWSSQQIVFYFPKGVGRAARLRGDFNRVLKRFREAGLVSKWISDEMDEVARLQEASSARARATTGGVTVLSTGHLAGCFTALAAGLACAAAAFVLRELARGRTKPFCHSFP